MRLLHVSIFNYAIAVNATYATFCREDLHAQQLNAQLASARDYASSLLSTWHLGHCKESVLIFCSENESMVGCCYSCWYAYLVCLMLLMHNYALRKE